MWSLSRNIGVRSSVAELADYRLSDYKAPARFSEGRRVKKCGASRMQAIMDPRHETE
jgi:hypothetical protein